MLAVVPAAGLGSRFLPLSRAVPKELLPLGPRPLVHHALAEAERAGFRRAVLVVSPAKAALRAYFEPAPDLERELRDRGDDAGLARLREAAAIAARLDLRFVEQPAPAGFGDAVACGGRLAGGEPYAVLTPDDVISGAGHWTDVLALHATTAAPCVSVRPVPAEQAHRFGVAVCAAGPRGGLRVERLVEKPPAGRAPSNLAVLGRYVITPDVQAALERAAAEPVRSGEVQLTDALAGAIGRPPGVLAAPFAGELFDCGTPDEYARSWARYAATGAGRTPQVPAAAAAGPAW